MLQTLLLILLTLISYPFMLVGLLTFNSLMVLLPWFSADDFKWPESSVHAALYHGYKKAGRVIRDKIRNFIKREFN